MKRAFLLSLVAGAALLGESAPAEACGGCFVPQSERTVVTDHRMALSVSTEQTVLWDQIRYAGDPREFAWVLPVRSGAKIEVSNDEWFTALDASTQPVIYQPQYYGGAYGCGLTGCGSQSTSDSTASAGGGGQVQIISQSVVGPYETVTLRASDPNALTTWLTSHAYDIPSSISPTIKAYVDEGFDFIALRLLPTCGERAMRPVRVVTKGADPTLPLRMVAAGVGANVGITLYVVTEGRFHPQNFQDALVDDDQLRWDRTQNKSNYDTLSQTVMAGNNGRTWITEYADKPQLFGSGTVNGAYYNNYARGTPGLADVYYGQCRGAYQPSPAGSSSGGSSGGFTPCPRTADAGVSNPPPPPPPPVDAGADADAGDDGGSDAEAPPPYDAGTEPPPDTTGGQCAYLDDLNTALTGLHTQDVWVTRLRAILPTDALSEGDLRLEPAHDQTRVSNVHYAPYYTDDDAPSSRHACLSAPTEHRAFGSWVIAATLAIAAIAYGRRRARP
jgi:hypothetical protein